MREPPGPLLGQLHLAEPERPMGLRPRGRGHLPGIGSGADFYRMKFFRGPGILETEGIKSLDINGLGGVLGGNSSYSA